MADDKYTAEVGVDTSDLQRELARSEAALDKFAKNFQTASAAIQDFQRVQTSLKNTSFNLGAQNIPLPNKADVSRQVQALSTKGIDGIGANLETIKAQEAVFASYSKNIQAAAQSTRDMKTAQDNAYASYAPNIRATQELAKSTSLNAAAQKEAYASYAPNIRASRDSAAAEQQRARVFEQGAQAQTAYAAAAQRNGVAYGDNVTGSLNETRYALYDVAATWASVSAATLGAVVAIESVGIAYESAFTGVERTSGAVGARLGELRDNLVSMSTSMPSSFAEIADVATLGGQLGIASEGLEDFTETVIQLGATTDLTLETAGTAFGRFKALLGTPEEEFSNLGSSILKVGVNSAATETQIVNVATQISSLSNLAGLTADQTVGLAGALASVGAAPELSRGTITRVFSLMNQAVSEGGESLEGFARLAGISGQEFQDAWGTDAAAGVFQDFLRGIDSQGQGAISALNELGITSVRDVPLLLRLAGAGDVVSNSFADAASGYAENSELANQYGLVADDTASMLMMLANTVKAIADEAANLGILKGGIDLLQQLADAALAFVQSPIGGSISSIALSIGAVIGVLAAFRAGLALAQASAAGLIVAQNALSSSATRNALSISSLAKNMISLSIGTDRATAASARYTAVTGAVPGMLGRVAGGAATAGTAVLGLARAFAPIAIAAGAVWAVTEAMRVYNDTFASAEVKTEKFFGSFEGLDDALRADTLEGSANAIRSISTNTEQGAVSAAAWRVAIQQASDAQVGAVGGIEGVNTALAEQNVLIDSNTQKWLAKALNDSDALKALYKESGVALEEYGFSLETFSQKMLDGTANDYVTQMLSKARIELAEASVEASRYGADMEVAGQKVIDLQKVVSGLEGLAPLGTGFDAKVQENVDSLNFAQMIAEATGTTLEDLGYAGDVAAEGLEGVSDGADDAVKKLQDLTNAVTGPVTDTYALADSLYSLGESLYTNGTAFDSFSEAGRANMGSLQGVISAAVASSNGDASVLAANLKGVMDNLISYGVDIANQVPSLLALYQQVVGGASQMLQAQSIAMRVVPGMGGIAAAMGVAATQVNTLGKASIDTGTAMASGFGSGANKAAKAAKKAGGGAKEAAKEIRTLSDYVKDLSGVFSSAFDIRYGLDNATDEVSEAYRSLAKLKSDAEKDVADAQEALMDASAAIGTSLENLQDARQDVADLRDELQSLAATLLGLQSDKNILQYQMGVAVEYGDTLRQADIAAELAKVNADIAKNQTDQSKTATDLARAQKGVSVAEQGVVDARTEVTAASGVLTTAQSNLTRTLDGGTESSVEQRAAVLALVQGYAGQVAALANTGLSTQQLAARTAELKKQFEDQLRQLGYNNVEIAKYSKSFDDMSAAINRIPRNITVTASTDPAQRAIDEFMARNTGGRGASGGVNVPISSSFDDSAMRRSSRAAELTARIAALTSQSAALQLIPGQQVAILGLVAQIQMLKNQLASGNYASGGYTGRGGKYEPAGVVHRGEYVVPKSMVNQSTGLPYMNALGAIARGYSGGGYVSGPTSVSMPSSMVMELSPTDRALLAAAGNVTLTVDGRVLASSVNNNNTRNANRG